MKLIKNNIDVNRYINFTALLIVFVFPLVKFIFAFFAETNALIFNIIYLIVCVLYLLPKFILWLINCKSKKEYLFSLKSRPELIVLIAFLIWMTISCFFSPEPSVAFLGINRASELFEEGLIQFLSYTCMFYFAYTLKDENWQIRLLKIFAIITFIIATLTYIDPYGHIFPAFFDTYPYSSTFVNSNHYGYFLCLAVMINVGLMLFEKKLWQQILFGLNSIVLITQMLFNGSFGPSLAIFITLLILPFAFKFFKQKWNFLTFAPITIFVIAAIFIQNANFYKDFVLTIKEILGIAKNDANLATYGTGRIELWIHTLHLIIQNPIFGTGLGNFTMNGFQNRPHNEYLQYAVNTGIMGGLLYIIAIVLILIRAIKSRKETSNLSFIFGGAIVCYLISAFFGNTMPHVMPFFAIFLAMYIYSIKPNKKELEQ